MDSPHFSQYLIKIPICLFQDIVEPLCKIEVDGQVTGITTIGVCTYLVYCKDHTNDFYRNRKVFKKYKNLLEIIQKVDCWVEQRNIRFVFTASPLITQH